jgi:hypothetical protein
VHAPALFVGRHVKRSPLAHIVGAQIFYGWRSGARC